MVSQQHALQHGLSLNRNKFWKVILRLVKGLLNHQHFGQEHGTTAYCKTCTCCYLMFNLPHRLSDRYSTVGSVK